MPSKIYKLGLIGAGRWGKNIISTINKMDDVQITHLCTSNALNTKLINNPVRTTGNYHDLFFDKTIDAVIIATPPSIHMDIMRDCITTVMPFMIEKPACLNVTDALKLQELLLKTKVACLVDYTQLYNPAFVELQKLFKNRKIETVNTKLRSFGPFRKDVSIVWDWAPHDVAMALTLLQAYPEKIDVTYIQNEDYDNSGHLDIKLEFKKSEVNISIDNTSETKYRSLTAKAGYSTMTIFGSDLYEIRDNNMAQMSISRETPLKKAIEEFILNVETGSQEGVNLTVDVTRILEKCTQIIGEKYEKSSAT